MMGLELPRFVVQMSGDFSSCLSLSCELVRRQVAERGVGPLGVVVAPPCLDDDLCLGEAVEDLAVEEFVAKLRVEALAVAVLPRAAGSMNAVLAPTSAIHSRTALAITPARYQNERGRARRAG